MEQLQGRVRLTLSLSLSLSLTLTLTLTLTPTLTLTLTPTTAKVEYGSSVAVFGLGAVGFAVVQACKAVGATHIVGVDVNPKK